MQQIDSLLKDIPLGCKILYVLSFVVFVIGLFVTNFTILLANVSYFTYANNQYWRLFSSVLSPGVSLFSIISLIVDFCLIRFFFAKIEKKYSSIYFLTQIILQNLIIQILFTFVSVILIQIGIISIVSLLGFGWAPLLIIFSFKNVHETQQETLKVLCFQVPKKHLSLVVILISFILGYSQFLCLLVAVGLGYLQFVVLKRHLIKLPISYYKFWDKIIPKFITSRQDYIQVQFVQSVLQVECSTFSIQKIKRFFNFSKNKKTQTKTTQNQSKKSYGENHKSLNEQILENTDNIYAGDKEQNDRSTIDSKKIDCDQIFL